LVALSSWRIRRFDAWIVDRGGVSTTAVGIVPDPLTDALAGLLAAPLRELYAVLWRVGVVEIVD
jgi:hypothetical protein